MPTNTPLTEANYFHAFGQHQCEVSTEHALPVHVWCAECGEHVGVGRGGGAVGGREASTSVM